jgi:hypothetical protein
VGAGRAPSQQRNPWRVRAARPPAARRRARPRCCNMPGPRRSPLGLAPPPRLGPWSLAGGRPRRRVPPRNAITPAGAFRRCARPCPGCNVAPLQVEPLLGWGLWRRAGVQQSPEGRGHCQAGCRAALGGKKPPLALEVGGASQHEKRGGPRVGRGMRAIGGRGAWAGVDPWILEVGSHTWMGAPDEGARAVTRRQRARRIARRASGDAVSQGSDRDVTPRFGQPKCRVVRFKPPRGSKPLTLADPVASHRPRTATVPADTQIRVSNGCGPSRAPSDPSATRRGGSGPATGRDGGASHCRCRLPPQLPVPTAPRTHRAPCPPRPAHEARAF